MASRKFDVGCRVRVVGLQKKPEENGSEGRVVGFCEEKQRYKVELPRRSEPFNFKCENLEIVVAPTPKRDNENKAMLVDKADGPCKRLRDDSSPSPTHKKKRIRDSNGKDVSGTSGSVDIACRSEEELSSATESVSRGKVGSSSAGSMLQISKALSLILRHKAVQFGLTIRTDGFCVLSDVLNLPNMSGLHATQEAVEQITRTNAKQRFELSKIDGCYMIRALQGHSIKEVLNDDLLQRLELSNNLPAKCVHGTYSRHWTSILSKGLLAGGLGEKGHRNHIHFAPYDLTDKRVISGMRTDCDIAIYIDLRKALTAGVVFFMSKNQVILTEGEDGVLSSKYFQTARNIKTGEVLFPAGTGDG